MITRDANSERSTVGRTARGYGRGVLGALLVSMPLLATMEMWWQGFAMPPEKMITFLLVNFGVLVILEYYSGLQESTSLLAEILDALAAYGIGLLVALIALSLFGALRTGMGLEEVLGKVVLQSIPLSVGACIAMSQLGDGSYGEKEQRKRQARLPGSLALSLAGAWYFGFNIAPTEEPVMIGLRIEWWHGILLLLGSLLIAHAIVFSLGFIGGHDLPEERSWWGAILTIGVGSTLVALLTGAFFLYIFGAIGPGTALAPTLRMVAVMGFVNSLGAAAAKLIL